MLSLIQTRLKELENTLRSEGHWPPPDGWDPSSPEGKGMLHADPFVSFPIHPLPPTLQQFIDTHQPLDQGELDSIAELLEQIHHIQPPWFVYCDGLDATFIIDRS